MIKRPPVILLLGTSVPLRFHRVTDMLLGGALGGWVGGLDPTVITALHDMGGVIRKTLFLKLAIFVLREISENNEELFSLLWLSYWTAFIPWKYTAEWWRVICLLLGSELALNSETQEGRALELRLLTETFCYHHTAPPPMQQNLPTSGGFRERPSTPPHAPTPCHPHAYF